MKQLMFPDGPVVATASRVTPGDYDGWHDAWLSTAERLETEARRSHPISARDGLLRASSYRAAEFFLHGNPDDPRIDHAYGRSVAYFRDAVAHFTDITPVEMPYQDTVLRGYFYRAAGEGPKRALVMHNGFDGAAEELHFFGALGGQERGYHVLTFDGPGQPSAIHRDGMTFRPDWEKVVGPVLDFLTKEPGVDQARIALLGVSLGGYLAPRSCAGPSTTAATSPGPRRTGSSWPESDPRKLYRHLTAPKTLLSFTEEEGADAHRHPGALRLSVARIFDWLDDTV